jgi:superfamily I DNA and/or RNA helicase
LNRAKRLCIVGDPNQLQPVVNITEEKNQQLMDEYNVTSKYNYRTKSIFNTMIEVDLVSKFIFLDKHYRCHKKIATFSNKKYYNDKLDIQTDYKKSYTTKIDQYSKFCGIRQEHIS